MASLTRRRLMPGEVPSAAATARWSRSPTEAQHDGLPLALRQRRDPGPQVAVGHLGREMGRGLVEQ